MRWPPVGRFPLLSLTRRAVLAGLVAVGLVPQVRGQTPPDTLANPALGETLRVFLDTLVPADDTPGAAALGLHRELINEAATRTNYPEMLLQGTEWLDQQASLAGVGRFTLASEAIRDEIAAAAFAAEPGTLPRVFAEFIRQDVMRLYYARPESWSGIIAGPPQPDGYLLAPLPPGRAS